MLALAVGAANAQTAHLLTVSDAGGVCTYRIAGQADQAAFSVAPGDVVVLRSEGDVVARAVVGADGRSGLMGAEGQETFAARGGRSVAIDVRQPLGRGSAHDFAVECCASGASARSCERWVRAAPAGPRDPAQGELFPPGDPATQRAGGPRMVVVE
jgi:hypothetical protein